jgi:lysyl-tRNA synthetase class 2
VNGVALGALLRTRAGVLAEIRHFFAGRGVVEVTTPALSPAAPTDPALASLELEVAALGGRRYLSTSPEFGMKRLLAAGSGDIYELARVFRDGELGRWHQPEFLLLEWYRLGFTERELMDEVHALLEATLAPRLPRLERRNLSYADAFGEAFGIDPHALDAAGAAALRERLGARGIDVPAAVSGPALLDLALVTAIVPHWPRDTALFLYDYPVDQAALAAIRPGPPPVAARFEVFVNGLELGNGFRELTDAAEQRRRFEADLAARRARGLEEPPLDEALLAALEQGLPECAGVALGVDRLIALLLGVDTLADAVLWPHQR